MTVDALSGRLVVASEDKCLRRLTCGASQKQNVKLFPGGLTGHHGRINDVCFCNPGTYETHVASVGDDGFLLWNLYPQAEALDNDESMERIGSAGDTDEEVENSARQDDANGVRSRRTKLQSFYSTGVPATTNDGNENAEEDLEPARATNYPIPFSHPLHSISSHPKSANQFMVSDTHGTVFIIDWTKLDQEKPQGWRGHRVVELVDPRGLSDSASAWGGSAHWNPDDLNL